MSEKQRQKVAFIALGVAIIFGAYNLWPTKQVEEPVVVNKTIQPLAPSKELAPLSQNDLIDIEKLEPLSWGEDPFRGVLSKNGPVQSGMTSWILTGIIYHAEKPVAIINNQAVKIGDEIDRAEVVTIGRKEVTLKYGDREITLKVTKS